MNTSFDNKGRMVLEVNDTLKIALDFEAAPNIVAILTECKL